MELPHPPLVGFFSGKGDRKGVASNHGVFFPIQALRYEHAPTFLSNPSFSAASGHVNNDASFDFALWRIDQSSARLCVDSLNLLLATVPIGYCHQSKLATSVFSPEVIRP